MSEEKIKIQFKDIGISEFSYRNPLSSLPENIPFRVNVEIKHKVNLRTEIIDAINDFIFLINGNKEPLAKVEISCRFHIESMKKHVNESGRFEISDQLADLINYTSLSTCRGILFSLFRGTAIDSFILPMINSEEIIKTSITDQK